MGDTRQMLRFGVPGLFPASCATLEQLAAQGRSIAVDCELCESTRRPTAPRTVAVYPDPAGKQEVQR